MELLGKLSFGSTGWGDELLIGAVMTVGLALASVLIGIVIGGKLAFFKLQPNRFFRTIAHAITLLFRGTDKLTQCDGLAIHKLGQADRKGVIKPHFECYS